MDTYDAVAADLRALRHGAGSPSYSDIALSVSRLRVQRGVDPARARCARSTVYDVFGAGRTRMNADLVADIAAALGDEDPDVWRARCWAIQEQRENQRLERVEEVERQVAEVDQPGEPAQQDVSGSAGADPIGVPTALESSSASLPTASPAPARLPRILLVILGCVALDVLGILVARVTGLPLYLDMVGVGAAAMVLGPWWGVAAAVGTHVAALAINPVSSLLMLPVSITGALVWGYGVRWFRTRASVRRQAGLHLLVGVACSLVATPILAMYFHGFAGLPTGLLHNVLVQPWQPVLISTFIANLSTSVPDKLISGLLIGALTPTMLMLLDPHGDPDGTGGMSDISPSTAPPQPGDPGSTTGTDGSTGATIA